MSTRYSINELFITNLRFIIIKTLLNCAKDKKALVIEDLVTILENNILFDPIGNQNYDFKNINKEIKKILGSSSYRIINKNKEYLCNYFQYKLMENIYDLNALYILTFLKQKSSIKLLSNNLLKIKTIYGWEGPDYSKISSYTMDSQFPWQEVYIKSLIYIGDNNFSHTFEITKYDLIKLIKEASIAQNLKEPLVIENNIEKYFAALWIVKYYCKNNANIECENFR